MPRLVPPSAASAQPAWDNPPPFTYGFSEHTSLPSQDLYSDDPGEEFYSEDSDKSSVSDALGLAAVDLLRKYNPSAAQPVGVSSASVPEPGFFRPPPSSQSGISVPPDFLAEFDRVAATPTLKPTPISFRAFGFSRR